MAKLSPKQKKIAAKAGDPNKIEGVDFAKIRQEKEAGADPMKMATKGYKMQMGMKETDSPGTFSNKQSLIMQMAVIQGMHMAKKAGVDLELYSMMISGLPVSLKTDQERHIRAIIDGDFSNVQASNRTWKEALDRILDEGKGSNFNVELLSGIGEVLRNGQDQGVGEEDLAALIKTMG